ncbi:unnamed protein product [Moneuplotes crassus]|uniref:Poly(A) RNA polymerase mitochondrial-like central palm domain-containing protein n=1 Tax=Euplotes crassus TaxID=5936 RepID=A0AAD1XBV3_EUPCR|nr:unnamed protein product [Moneuplotes crassus]
MESTYEPKLPEDETLSKFWDGLSMCPGKDNLHLVLNNKYYHIGKDKKNTPRQSQKGKLSKTEWFESLEIVERVEAISTIVHENYQILQALRNDIRKLENKQYNSSSSHASQDYDDDNDHEGISPGSSLQNWEVVIPPELPGCMHEIIQKLTFLDTKYPEDTITVQEDLVADPLEFFHTIKTAWEELEDSDENISGNNLKLKKMLRLTFGDNFNEGSKMLCGKILCLIEIALHNSYSRAINDKRNYNPKSFLDPGEANWRKTEKIFLEYLDLKDEILHFIKDTQSDDAEADEYLKTEEALAAYNVHDLKKPPKNCTDRDDIQFYNEIKSMILRDIKEYRTHLITMIRPCGDAQKGYKIFRTQKELYQIINESRIFQNNRYSDDRIRQFARYLFDKLTKKGDDKMAEMLVLEFLEEETKKEEPSKGRKRNKNKQANQQKKDKVCKQETQTQKNQSNPNNQKQKSKASPSQKSKKNPVEIEKKLADELTATERSSKIDHDNDLLETDKQQYIDDGSVNGAIKDLENIMVQETKSECEKEDEYKLEKDLKDSKAHHDGDKLDPYLFTKNKIEKEQIKISSLSTKECDKIGNAATNSGSEEINFESKTHKNNKKQEVTEKIITQKKPENKKSKILNSPKSESNNCISHSSEVVSLHSEEKRLKNEQTPESPSKMCKVDNQRRDQNDFKSKKQNKSKKGKQNKNKNKKNKKQQNQKQQNQKQQQKKKMNTSKKDGSEKESQKSDIDAPLLSKAKTHDCPQTPQKALDEEPDASGMRSFAKNSGKEPPKGANYSPRKGSNKPPQYFNKKLNENSEISEKHSLRSSGSFKDDVELSKSKSQSFQTKSYESRSFKSSHKDHTGLEQPLYDEETKGESIDGSFDKFTKHANYQPEAQNHQQMMQMQMNQECYAQPEMSQGLDQNMPAYAYPFGSYHPPQPMYNEAYNQMNDPTYRQYISKQIMDETTNITLYSDLIQKYRLGIKKEIEKVAKEAFGQFHKRVEAHIYGSVATELALPESDMDVMITGVNSFGSSQVHSENITEMHNALKEYFDEEILISSASILNTQVPIIKLKFNLEKYYEVHDNKGDIFVPFINFASTDASGSSLKELSVDISMSDSYEGAHMSLKQSAFVKEKLEQYPVLRPVCLTLKKLLIANGYNDPYTGGLGSYGLFIMLYAALCFENMNSDEMFQQEATYKGRLFIYFFSMYSPEFDVENKCIFFFPDGMPIVVDKFGKIPGANSKLLCVYDPTDNKSNITSKAFRIKEIQEWFKSIKEKMTCK